MPRYTTTATERRICHGAYSFCVAHHGGHQWIEIGDPCIMSTETRGRVVMHPICAAQYKPALPKCLSLDRPEPEWCAGLRPDPDSIAAEHEAACYEQAFNDAHDEWGGEDTWEGWQ